MTNTHLVKQHASDAISLHEDFRGLIDDAERESGGETIRYAVDQSEIYSYVLPESTTRPLRILSDDPDDRTVAVQHYVLNKLFHGLAHELVILPPYVVELRAFANQLSRRGFDETVGMLPEMLRQARSVVASAEFAELESVVNVMHRGEHPDPGRMKNLFAFLKKEASQLLRLIDGTDMEPIRRLNGLLDERRLQPLGAVVPPTLQPDVDVTSAWQAALRDSRPTRSGANDVDAEALGYLAAANHWARQEGRRVAFRLVTRSPHMLDIDRQCQTSGAATGQAGSVLRHPRAFIALRRLEGRPTQSAATRLKIMQTSLEVMRRVVEDGPRTAPDTPALAGPTTSLVGLPAAAVSDATRPSDGEGGTRLAVVDPVPTATGLVVSVDGPLIDERVATEAQMLIENIREQLEDGANLASIAAVSRNSPRSNQTTADHDRARVIRLFEMIRDEKQLLHEIEKQVGKLADEVDHSQQLMPVALQGSSVNQVAPSLVIKAENGRTVVGTTLYWMPYRLEFSDPDLVDWSERVAADQPMTAVAILRQFQDGFARGLDYEVLLALGYVLGALDRWDLALPYSDLALLQAGLSSPPQPSHEGKFFKALCLRMLSLRPGESTRQLADRYREAVDLLDEAIDSRKRAESRPDARYAIEKATVLLRWSRLEWVADDANALGRAEALERRAVRATQTALSVTRRDEMARAQIYNILCFHYLETDYTRWVPEIRRHLRLLEEMIEQRPPLREWPPNFLDTVLVAHCRLPDQPLDRDYVRELSGALKEALDKPGVSGIRPRDRARAEAHLAEAEMALSAAAAT